MAVGMGNNECPEGDHCFRPTPNKIFEQSEFVGNAFYPIDNQQTFSIDSSAGIDWESGCVCGDDVCDETTGEGYFEKMTITFRDDGTFDYDRTLYADNLCAEELEIQDDDSSVSNGYWHTIEDYTFDYGGEPFLLTSRLFSHIAT